jgi:uncharacterized protein (DUF1684 family)
MGHSKTGLGLVCVVVLIFGAAACRDRAGDSAPGLPDAETANAAAAAWRVKHETDYRRDWVTIAGLHVLKPGSNTAGSAAGNDVVLPASAPARIGRFVLSGDTVRYEPEPGTPVTLRGEPVTRPLDLKDDSTSSADELILGDVRVVVHATGGRRSIRVRDPNGPLARGFLGFTWFPIDASYRVVGRFVRDSQPQRLKVVNTYGDIDEYATEGVLEFELQGRQLRVRPFTTRPKRLYIVFKDQSSGHETYEAARFLYADLRDDGTAVLDFNQAYNPPCAFNPHTTCPIPIPENRLPIKILAGEKGYGLPRLP